MTVSPGQYALSDCELPPTTRDPLGRHINRTEILIDDTPRISIIRQAKDANATRPLFESHPAANYSERLRS